MHPIEIADISSSIAKERTVAMWNMTKGRRRHPVGQWLVSAAEWHEYFANPALKFGRDAAKDYDGISTANMDVAQGCPPYAGIRRNHLRNPI
jgi:hypothetical protein